MILIGLMFALVILVIFIPPTIVAVIPYTIIVSIGERRRVLIAAFTIILYYVILIKFPLLSAHMSSKVWLLDPIYVGIAAIFGAIAAVTRLYTLYLQRDGRPCGAILVIHAGVYLISACLLLRFWLSFVILL